MVCIIEKMKNEDWKYVSQIYKEGIETNLATFQNEVPTWEEWDKSHFSTCRYVAKDGKEILGWIALSPTSSRCVYKGVAEVSVYVRDWYRGKSIGAALLKKVIEESEKEGIWTLQSGIIKENTGSINLHKRCGFREVGIRERIARMNNIEWMDVVMMERRSKIVGIS